jgi:hypothetical protein
VPWIDAAAPPPRRVEGLCLKEALDAFSRVQEHRIGAALSLVAGREDTVVCLGVECLDDSPAAVAQCGQVMVGLEARQYEVAFGLVLVLLLVSEHRAMMPFRRWSAERRNRLISMEDNHVDPQCHAA